MKRLALILALLPLLSCSAQKKEIIHLMYEPAHQNECDLSLFRNGKNKKTFIYKDQKTIKHDGIIIFEMCKAKFKYSVGSPRIINDTIGLNIKSMNYMYSEIEEDWPRTAQDVHFEKIYILEKKRNGTYLQYEVKWIDSFR